SMPVQKECPKSRITLTYVTEVDGEPAARELPFRMMILGDFSQGTSKDRKQDFSERKVRSFNGANTSEIMKDMNVSIDMVVPNKIDPETEESIRVSLKVDGIESFNPAKVAKQVPQVRSLLLFKKLLEEIQSNIANKKEFSQLLNKLYANQTAFEKLKEELKAFAPTLPKKNPAIGHETNENEENGNG
ncbi:MAG: type VI secretion system contractile sheath small subunit, partial [Chlamydiia bacterium]|nr:type VI secretion system contractile sheath small subunit [Chlamydiia bacterium]